MADIKPTRSELINLKKKIKLAQVGHDLLKRKKDGLVQEFFRILDLVKEQRKTLVRNYRASVSKLEIARALEGTASIESIAFALKDEPEVIIHGKSIMGVKVPQITTKFVKRPLLERGYGLIGTSSYTDELVESWENLLEMVVRSVETETTLKRILLEIEKTKRRVSALEYVVIPNMEGAASFIRLRLEEMERENLFRLKRIKKKHEKIAS
ncbi:TPA: V-type ATP synthase subunit D [archaeon]|uniref:A-type ATP synthase subunit D n=1 Tax=Candidatus Naiadarchaeum limnaeum TaxID=2756139 RepID=A0A832V0Z2_9ARCH|nr:V-type ATP synthase subunit D [Candidatus Naiadarchaeales archaeon SRR2090153.bin1042]HIK00223.1 V-type ATP synthase subunit D [Candidatus Naiadarchaeum limnaeum]